MKKNVTKKILSIVGICIILITIGGYLYYQHIQQQRILESMNITFNENVEIEYGTKDYDVEKEVIKEVENAKIKETPKIDTMKIGEQALQFILINNELEKQVEYKIKIIDTKAPEITLKKDSIEITVGDTFTISSNINSVKDIVDGDISYNDKAIEINKKATEKYNKLDAKEIKNDTKVADKSLNEFLIEDIKDKEEKNLYLKNCYYIDNSVDISKTGKYKVNVIAVDKNGLKTIKEFTVEVKEKEVQQLQRNNASINNQGSSSTQSSHTAVKKGSIQDVINTACAQVGKRYVLGGRGPDSFDCDGLILYAFSQNGYAMSSSSATSGYSIGTDATQAMPGDIIVIPNHAMLYLGEGRVVQAMNPSQGIREGLDWGLNSWLGWATSDRTTPPPIQILDIRRVR